MPHSKEMDKELLEVLVQPQYRSRFRPLSTLVQGGFEVCIVVNVVYECIAIDSFTTDG